ncbi:hypothetical protein BVRB_019470, partial [Beta vulgaris subsp. vulgaris]
AKMVSLITFFGCFSSAKMVSLNKFLCFLFEEGLVFADAVYFSRLSCKSLNAVIDSDNEAAGPISTSTLLLPSDLQGILASDLIRQRRSSPFKPIVSMCPDLDRILGGGFAIGLLTEICGLPGLGKTQLCMQLACTVQIPPTMQGNQGEAIYIDCEGSLVAQRQLQIAEALCAILQKSGNAISAETMLSRIHVYRVFNAVQQQSVIR